MALRVKTVLKTSLVVIALFCSLLTASCIVFYTQQDQILQQLVTNLNEDFSGKLKIEDSHIAPFANFPYLSVDLEGLTIYEGKSDTSERLLQVQDTYVGFNLFSILNASFEVKKIKLENGYIKLVQHTDGSFNVVNALSKATKVDKTEEGNIGHLDLRFIELINIDLLKINEANDILVETFIEYATASIKTADSLIAVDLESQLLFNLIVNKDTSFLHDKHLKLQTAFNYNREENILNLKPSRLAVENASFNIEGNINVDDDMYLDLHFTGNKPNFDLFFAFAPPEIQSILERYDNGGSIYFDASVVGKSIEGHSPAITVDFGCEDAFIQNNEMGSAINDLFFKGHFTNGELRKASTMELQIADFSASPATGIFKGNISVKNFESPEFDIQLLSEFDLDFLTKFIGIKNLEDISGKVALEMNFHDIIDLSQPERSIERLNESYFTKLVITNLNVNSSVYPLPIKHLNVKAEMDGHKALIKEFSAQVGNSDISLSASISDLPAILHHSNQIVDATLNIKSNAIYLNELSRKTNDPTSTGIDELITDVSLRLKLRSSANAFTESPNLPIGEFFIEELHAKLNNYPHELHDFNADILIDSNNFQVIDFTGMLDQSDFHFSGQLDNYELWFQENPTGETKIDFNLRSKLIQLEDLFTYGGENYVPEDYRHEEFRDLQLHGLARLNFNKSLVSTQLQLDKLETKLKVHAMKFKEVAGELYLDSTMLDVKNFKAKLGKSDLQIDGRYYWNPEASGQAHQFKLYSKQLDFDELFAYQVPPKDQVMSPQDHEDVFNIFQLPFSELDFKIELGKLNYHRYVMEDFYTWGSMHQNHYIYVDTLGLKAAGGQLNLSGYFNGSNPKAIYFSPNLMVNQIDLDKLLFKFENFGQDHLVSENLHGQLSGSLQGKIHLHADLVPIIDDSELHLELKVVNGSLTNYSAMEALSAYFADKNLSNVRFDTLINTVDLKNGEMIIPKMDINTTLGYFQISGRQSTKAEMEYYVSVPIKVVTAAGFNKLFKRKIDEQTATTDSIQAKEDYQNRAFLNLKIEGNPDNYKVSLGKKK